MRAGFKACAQLCKAITAILGHGEPVMQAPPPGQVARRVFLEDEKTTIIALLFNVDLK